MRDQDVATPALDAPFTLEAEPDRTVREHERDLFERDLQDLVQGLTEEPPLPETPKVAEDRVDYDRRRGTDPA